jgi:hypothetical protein
MDGVRLGGLVALIASAQASPASAQEARAGGSSAPCAVPLQWRVTRVDREFGIDITQAAEIVREATDLWQGAASQPLFAYDEAEGFPLRIVYDERQERSDERLRRQRTLDAEVRRLEVVRTDLGLRSELHQDAARRHTEDVRSLEARAAAHNATVRDWNERGGAPPNARTDLEAVGDALDEERARLSAAGRALENESSAIRQAQERLNRDVAAYNRRVEELGRDFPSVSFRSGEYREAVQRVGGRVVGISREIRIYRFASREELRLIAAHELGHALGLGHVPNGDGVMSEQYDTGVHPEGIDRIGSADAALLASRCPHLASEGR